MKRRTFIKKAAVTAAATVSVPYLLPSGRLFAATGSRVVNHVVFVLFGGGIRNQESVDMQYLANQGVPTQGNIMQNMLAGAAPTQNLVYSPWTPILTQPLSQ
ncbi:MAG: twin-arginine translocation signal domain-containing protein, partial [Saprospiraceae bacterium]|nr:twin-arginine translocation signal domain-containing protein [Saprospiraceae bacterium]